MAKSVNKPAVTVPCQEGLDAIRCSFVTLATPRAFQEGSAPKFEVTLMFDKKNETHLTVLRKLIDDLVACSLEQWPDEATRPRTPIVAKNSGEGPRSPVKDGDVAINDKRIKLCESNPEYAGHYIVKASCVESQRPHVVGPNKEAIDPNLCRSGYWYKVNLNAYAYTGGSGGVTVGLNGVQLIREDETLGGGKPSADSMFGAVAGGDVGAYKGDDPLAATTPGTGAAGDLLGQPAGAAKDTSSII